MDTTEKMIKAKVQLILEQPFFASLALRMEYLEDASVKTAITNGKVVRYNPDYINNLSIDEVKGVIAHEVMHIAMLHHTRRNDRNLQKWNKATDYAINPLLVASGFVLPEDCLISDDFQNKSAEEIYNLLPDAPPNASNHPNNKNEAERNERNGNSGDDTGGMGDVEDLPADEDVNEVEADMKQAVAQASMIAKRQGKLPGYLERLVQKVLKPRISWKEVLSRFLAETTRNDYTWKKPSTRFLHIGLYLPSLETEEAGKIILIVDTSISISQNLINQFAGEMQDIANTFNTSLQIIYVDTKVRAVQNIERDEPVKLHPQGGGGTDFRPGFHYIDENSLLPKAVVYLTDGECDRFPDAPDYPVLWAQFGDSDFDPPFGEVIQVN